MTFRTTLISLLAVSHASFTHAQTLEAPPPLRPGSPYVGQLVVRATLTEPRQVMQACGLAESVWSHRIGLGDLDLQVTASAREALTQLGIPHRVLIADLERAINEERENSAALLGGDWYSSFHTLAEIDAYGAGLVSAYPTLASRISVGQTLEGRTIWALRLSAPDAPGNPRSARPQIVFNACQHAREWATPPTAMYIAERLLEDFTTDARLRALMESCEFLIVPVSNPDGYSYTWTNQRMWRKNRRPNGNGTFGVDLNRNWSIGWGGNDGSSPDPGNDTYRGPAPFSEPESTALRDFIVAQGRVIGSIDIHSYSQLILSPWGYTEQLPPDAAVFDELNRQMESAVREPFGTEYVAGPTATTIYIATGTASDWTYGELDGFGYGVEVRDTGQFGFLLPADQIRPNAIENQRMAMTYAEFVLAPLRITFPTPLPTRIAAGSPVTIEAVISDGVGALNTSTPTLHWRQTPASSFETIPLAAVSGRTFRATIPALACGRDLEFYLSASTTAGVTVTSPAGAPAAFHRAEVTTITTAYDDPCEAATGWTVGAPGDNATTGLWSNGVPQATAAQPGADHSPSGTRCWMTDGRAGQSVGTYDIDGGTTTLTSPRFSALGNGQAVVSYWRWYSNNQGSNANTNTMPVQISSDDGATWTALESVSENAGAWVFRSFDVAQFTTRTDRMRLRFIARDLTGAVVEAGVDDVRCEISGCPSDPADFNGDGFVDFFDYDDFVRCYEVAECPPGRTADINGDDFIDFFDYDDFVRLFEGG